MDYRCTNLISYLVSIRGRYKNRRKYLRYVTQNPSGNSRSKSKTLNQLFIPFVNSQRPQKPLTPEFFFYRSLDFPPNQNKMMILCLWTLALFLLSSASGTYQNATTRTYYVAAVEEEWDYMPRYYPACRSGLWNPIVLTRTSLSGMDMMNGVPIEWSQQAAAVAGRNGQRIGHVYKKALFREYTDGSFSQQSPRPEVCLQCNSMDARESWANGSIGSGSVY